MPITNIVILLFILAMMYMGSVQGLFSSFLHLLVVVAAGSIAFGVWEPLTLGLLMKYIPVMAWTVGLLLPFALALLIFRVATDKLVPTNVHFLPIMNTLFGAGFGFLSGVLTAGIAILGLSFLPFGTDLGGYAPYAFGSGGSVDRTDSKLWLPVNDVASNFYNMLSRGAFSTRTPLAEYQPELASQASLVRLRDENVSIVASPDAVKVTGLYIQDATSLTGASPATALALGEIFKRPGYKLVLVETEWTRTQGTFDGDRYLRLPSSHIRLITRAIANEKSITTLADPIGFAKGGEGESRVLYIFDSDGVNAFGTDPANTFTWVFLVPAEQQPRFLLARHLRLSLPDDEGTERDAEKVLVALGAPPASPAQDTDDGDDAQGPTKVGDRTGTRAGTYALDIEISNKFKAISKNYTSGLTLGDGVILEGSGSSRKTPSNIGQRVRVDAFDIPELDRMVRITIKPDMASSLFGRSVASAAALQPIFLTDSKGKKWQISAYVWRKENGDQEFYFDAFQPIQNAKQLPIGKMGKDDELFLYFSISVGTELVSYDIGSSTSQDLEPPLIVE